MQVLKGGKLLPTLLERLNPKDTRATLTSTCLFTRFDNNLAFKIFNYLRISYRLICLFRAFSTLTEVVVAFMYSYDCKTNLGDTV
jgi:hypothetical protein